MWANMPPPGPGFVGIRHDDPARCSATKAVELDPEIWGEEVEYHRCLNPPGHDDRHRCRACGHRWEDAA